MKKILILAILVLFSLSLTGCLPKKSTQEKTTGKEAKETPAKGKGGESYTFKALKAAIALGIPLKCSYKVSNVEYEGFIKGKQWRGKIDFGDGKKGEVIMKDNCIYSWDNNTNQGMKMCFEKDMWESEEYKEQAPDMEYHCAPAIIDEGKFTPPANVTFVDLGKMGQEGK